MLFRSLICTGSTNFLIICSGTTTAVVDSVSVKEVPSLASLYYANQWGVQQVHSLPIYNSYDLPGKPAANSDDVYEYLLLPSRPDTKTETEISKYLLKTMNGVVRRNMLLYTADVTQTSAWTKSNSTTPAANQVMETAVTQVKAIVGLAGLEIGRAHV